MSECYIELENDNAVCVCDNCQWTGFGHELEAISDIQLRLTPGGTVPAGQCPDTECNALAYLVYAPGAGETITLEMVGKLFDICNVELFTTDSRMDLSEVIEVLTQLCNLVYAYKGETENLWSIGEGNEATVQDMIIGAHWFSSHYSGGQDCPVYALGCATGKIYQSGCETENENDSTYQALVALHDQ